MGFIGIIFRVKKVSNVFFFDRDEAFSFSEKDFCK